VDVRKLDNLPIDDSLYNFINIDVQGYELEVFKGGIETLKNIDYIYSEVNRAQLYKGCVLVEELDQFLEIYGFKRVGTWWDGIT
ncbi:FkbM family methyltransferase, partial [Clostridioides difficile]